MRRPGSPARVLAAVFATILGGLALLASRSDLAAQTPPRQPLSAGSGAGLTIVSPPAGVPAFGTLEVVVDPGATVPRKVEFWFNGIKAGEIVRASW